MPREPGTRLTVGGLAGGARVGAKQCLEMQRDKHPPLAPAHCLAAKRFLCQYMPFFDPTQQRK